METLFSCTAGYFCLFCGKICQIPVRPESKWPDLASLVLSRERLCLSPVHSMLFALWTISSSL